MKRFFTLFLAAILVLGSCSPQKEAEGEKSEAKIPQVKTEIAGSAMISQVISFTGNIEPFVKNSISSSSAQRVEKIFVEVGDRVKKGDFLVQMENINYIQSKIQLENLKIDLSRMEALYKAGGVSKQQYDQMVTQVKVASESLENLNTNTKLLSPIDGVVTARNFDNGDLTMGQPILTVMQLMPVKIMINISEEFFPKVKVGTPVEVTLDVYDGKRFDGKISLIYPTVDPQTKTFVAQVTIKNGDMAVRPGMFARAKVNFGEKRRVVVSDKAVVKQHGTNDKYVYVLNGDIVNYVKVTLGKRVDSVYEVIDGINEGDTIVVAGQAALVDQTKVKVINSGADLSL